MRIASVRVVSLHVAETETCEVVKYLTNADEVPFRRSLTGRPVVCNIPVSSNGGLLEHVAVLCEV
jgi:hypothetical protein